MLPRVERYIQDIDERIEEMDPTAADCGSYVNYAMTAYIVLAGAGLIEIGVRSTLSEYGRAKGDFRIFEFIKYKVKRENSLDWGKIKGILRQFDSSWCDKIAKRTNGENISAIDSLKTHRDKIAHGDHAEVGYQKAKKYYSRAKCFISDFEFVVLNS